MKRLIQLLALSCIAAMSLTLFGCMGSEVGDPKADSDKINKNLEGMPKAPPDPAGPPMKKGG